MSDSALLLRDDGLAATKVAGERLGDLEFRVSEEFLRTPGRLLDVGCGRGRGSAFFAKRRFDAVGIDIDLETLKGAKGLAAEVGADCEFVLADGRSLCFRDGAFDYVVSFGSTLSEKFRVWMCGEDREAMAAEALRATRGKGLVVFDFVGRYWDARGFLNFLRYYWMWATERLTGRKTEFGDYTEKIGSKEIRFHGFTVREARSIFPSKGVRLRTWKRGGGRPFTDWFFVIAEKTARAERGH